MTTDQAQGYCERNKNQVPVPLVSQYFFVKFYIISSLFWVIYKQFFKKRNAYPIQLIGKAILYEQRNLFLLHFYRSLIKNVIPPILPLLAARPALFYPSCFCQPH